MKVDQFKRKEFEAPPTAAGKTPVRLSSIRAGFDAPSSRSDDRAQAGPSKARKVEPSSSKRKARPRSVSPSESPFDDPPKKMQLQPLPRFDRPDASRSATTTKKRKMVTPPRPERFVQPKRSPSKPATNLISAGAAALFDSVRPVEKPVLTAEQGGVRFLENVPQAPIIHPAWAGEGNGGEVDWSPTKKKKNFKMGGLASRATSIINAVKTDHTLWIHDISRTITANASMPLTPLLLSKLLQPAIRLGVVEILNFGVIGVAEVPSTPELWQESRTITALCSVVNENDLADDEQGLVVFSLHNRARNSSGPIAVSVPRRRAKQKDGSYKMDSVSIFVPGNPFDLRYIEVGSECWVWDTVHEVSISPTGAKDEGVIAGVEREEGEGEEDVFWDSRPEAVRLQEIAEKLADVPERKALVCSKFGLLV